MTPQKSILWSLISRGITYCFILAQGIIVARLLGPEGKGIQAKLMVSASFFIFFLDFGVSNSINYFFSQKKISFDLTKKLLKLILSLQFLFSIIIFLLLKIPLLNNFFMPSGQIASPFIWYIVITTFLDTTRLSLNSFLMASLKFNWINWIEIAQAIFRLVCYVSLYFFVQSDDVLFIVISIDLLGNIIAFASTFTLHLKLKKPAGDTAHPILTLNRNELAASILRYAFPLFLSNLVIYLNTRMDYLAIEKVMGLESLGYYTVASSGAQILTIVPAIIGAVIFSYMNQLQNQHKVDFFGFYSRVNFSLLLCVSILAIISAPVLIPLMFGPKFNESINLFQMLTVIALLQSYKYLLGIFLQSINQNKLRLKSDIFALLISIIFLYPAIKNFGFPGATFLLFVGQTISIVYIHYSLRNSYLKNIQLFFIQRGELKTLLSIDLFFKLSR